ncbi:MAG TPA: hypothetical protein VK034_25175 [Enhygromyxa sp.]|nr:hypothetical protein [Enhygromyxa sp.]
MSLPGAPLRKGALVQIFEGVVGLGLPNIVLFQYNPEKISHTITPWNPAEVDQTQRGAQAPTVQPFNPKQSFSISLELDASDEMAEDSKIAVRWGVADRLAALKKLTYASEGLLGDLLRSAKLLAGDVQCKVERPNVPVILFVWGPGRVLPVRVTSFSVEEKWYTPTLFPLHATVSLGLEVLTPDMFKCKASFIEQIAIATYEYTQLIDDVMAIVNAVQNVTRFSGLPPL